MNISEYFEIEAPVPFVDVDTVTDSAYFCQPFWIFKDPSNGSHVTIARTAIKSFDATWIKVLNSNDFGRLQELFVFPEPQEYRLGYGKRSSAGRGSGEVRAFLMSDALRGDLFLMTQVGILHRYEALSLFVDEIGLDTVSDMTLNVVREALITFTQEMMLAYPNLRRDSAVHGFKIWNCAQEDWSFMEAKVPTLNGSPLLLVPRHWADRRFVIGAGPFYTQVIAERLLLKNPELYGQSKPKTKLYEMYPFDREISRIETMEAYDETNANLVRKFYTVQGNRYHKPL